MIQKILDWIFPPTCLLCSRLLSINQQSKLVCNECENDFLYIPKPVCPRCGQHCEEGKPCGNCKDKLYFCTKNISLLDYKGKVQQAIHDFKFHGYAEKAKGFGQMLVKEYQKEFVDKIDIIVPIPMFNQKRKSRGYNQAELLAREVARLAKKQMVKHCLKRVKNTKSQSQLNAIERRNNIEDAFVVVCKEKVVNQRVLLIDDIYTTGSTIEECAKVLLENGAKEVFSLCLASPVNSKEI